MLLLGAGLVSGLREGFDGARLVHFRRVCIWFLGEA